MRADHKAKSFANSLDLGRANLSHWPRPAVIRYCALQHKLWKRPILIGDRKMLTDSCHRRRRLNHYRAVRAKLERMSEADLADIGIKRYQLGHIARVKALANL
jgi:uncharacterized protein YjiS (DUF1127 family)